MNSLSLAMLSTVALAWAASPVLAQVETEALRPDSAVQPSVWPNATVRVTSPVWTTVSSQVLPSEPLPPATPVSEVSQGEPTAEVRSVVPNVAGRPIVGIGGGVRIGVGEPNNGLVYGRFGFYIDEQLALSLRPAYIIGGSDQNGKPNNQNSFQMPLTLDFMPDHWFSPYIGVGLATNTDSAGNADAMISAGVDFRFAQNFSLVLGLNYIIQSSDRDNRDVQGISALYFRF